jgi:hypothetical protein
LCGFCSPCLHTRVTVRAAVWVGGWVGGCMVPRQDGCSARSAKLRPRRRPWVRKKCYTAPPHTLYTTTHLIHHHAPPHTSYTTTHLSIERTARHASRRCLPRVASDVSCPSMLSLSLALSLSVSLSLSLFRTLPLSLSESLSLARSLSLSCARALSLGEPLKNA